jgi:ubiquinone/menaquinone biosynthesis C-methylase UbiE
MLMTASLQDDPDLMTVKHNQQRTWASGNYAAVAARIQFIAEQLVDAADLAAGSQVLDVATGSGNAAIAAARSGASVTGIDYVPILLERARVRAAAEGFDVEFADGDAEVLSFPDASFDAVISVLGVMFATNQEHAASELLRVRPSGRHDSPSELDPVELHRGDAPDRRPPRSGAPRRPLATPVGDRATAH